MGEEAACDVLLSSLVGYLCVFLCVSLFHCELKCKAGLENVTSKSASLAANYQIMIISPVCCVWDLIRPGF